jgi:hypothetical protein
MKDMPARRGRKRLLLLLGLVCVGAAGAAACYFYGNRGPGNGADEHAASEEEVIQTFCGACHRLPPPDVLPRSRWKESIEQMYTFFSEAGKDLHPPPLDAAVKYYESRAPAELPLLPAAPAAGSVPVRFERITFPAAPGASPPSIANVNLVHLFDEQRLDVLACDMRWGLVLALRPYAKAPAWQVLGKVPNPAHAEVVDLDGDGIKDILVANLGSYLPSDGRCGSVDWLRGRKDGRFTRIPLLQDVGRVADVQAADFRGVGKLDLVVAAFGKNRIGEIIYLENQTDDWDRPRFVPRVLDERHGAIHVPVVRLQGQGKDRPPDFVALISQEHETVVAFLNDGHGQFRKETIYTAPHPAYGSSGIQMVDLNGDGEPDILYTNGDTLDGPYLLKPYHGVQWLENPGKGRYPWQHHPIAPLYGAYRAVAADFTGTGRQDVAAVSFLPAEGFPQRTRMGLDAVLFLEATAPGRFVRHSLETVTCDHATCVAGDIYGSGRTDLVTGTFAPRRGEMAVTIWKNLGAAKGAR